MLNTVKKAFTRSPAKPEMLPVHYKRYPAYVAAVARAEQAKAALADAERAVADAATEGRDAIKAALAEGDAALADRLIDAELRAQKTAGYRLDLVRDAYAKAQSDVAAAEAVALKAFVAQWRPEFVRRLWAIVDCGRALSDSFSAMYGNDGFEAKLRDASDHLLVEGLDPIFPAGELMHPTFAVREQIELFARALETSGYSREGSK